jgi:PEGA domain
MRCLGSLVVLLLVAAEAPAQTGRQALAAGNERYLLADYRGALPLLGKGLDPTAGPLDGSWLQGMERLADVLLVLRQDSLAATWLRWAARLDPDFRVDEEVVPPNVARAARAARAFVDSTRHDRFVARVTFDWTAASVSGPGTVRLDRASIPITARIGTDQFLRGGEARRLPPGSYNVVVSAPGFLPTRLTVELLPGVTTQVGVALLPETAGLLYVAARPWATVFVDGNPIGYTSVAAHRVVPGRHVLRLEYEGGARRDTTIIVGERQVVRLAWLRQRDTTGDPQLDRAFAALDDADPERGTVLLRQWLTADAGSARDGTRSLALARLAEGAWSLGLRDSARVYLHSLVQAEPFFSLPRGFFNPDLDADYVRLRRETAAIAIRAPRDTVLTPVRDSLPIEIAVGRPGDVRLLLRLTRPRPHDSLLIALRVDSVGIATIPLTAPDGNALAPGQYAIEAEVAASGSSSSALLEVTVERLAADTTPSQSPIPVAAFRAEIRKGSPSLRTVEESVGLGALALLVSAAVNDAGVSGRAIPRGAWLIGGSVALVNLTLKRPGVPIAANVAYNDSLRRQWKEGDRAIATENVARLRGAPLRIRAAREP